MASDKLYENVKRDHSKIRPSSSTEYGRTGLLVEDDVNVDALENIKNLRLSSEIVRGDTFQRHKDSQMSDVKESSSWHVIDRFSISRATTTRNSSRGRVLQKPSMERVILSLWKKKMMMRYCPNSFCVYGFQCSRSIFEYFSSKVLLPDSGRIGIRRYHWSFFDFLHYACLVIPFLDLINSQRSISDDKCDNIKSKQCLTTSKRKWWEDLREYPLPHRRISKWVKYDHSKKTFETNNK